MKELDEKGGYRCKIYNQGRPRMCEHYPFKGEPNPVAPRWGGTIMRRNMDVFGRGEVTHPDHKTTVLRGWHRIFPNRENEA